MNHLDYFPTHVLYHSNYVEWIDRHKPYGSKSNRRWRLICWCGSDNVMIRSTASQYDYKLPENWRLA